MASGTLYTYPENVRAYKVLIAAKYSGANIDVVQDPPAFKLGETNKSPDFLQKFPLGKVPAFEGSDGTLLYESNAIAHYVANDQLRGANIKDQALVQQFINVADNEIQPAAATWVYPTLGAMQFNKQNTEKSKEQIQKVFTYLDEYLKTRTFLVGERVTLADISVATSLLLLYKQVLDPAFRKPFGNVNRYFITLVNQPQFKEVIGEVKLADKQAQFDATKYAELSGSAGKKDKKKDKKGSQPKQQPKKKEPKKPQNDDDDEETRPPPKKIDYFANVPKSTFILDDWKKMYSNNDSEVSMPWLWENLDRAAYSLWHCVYKYNGEHKMSFLASNAIGGFFQRVEGLRKHAFASMAIHKEDDGGKEHFSISGVWLFRGQDLAFELNPDWNVDAEHYNFKKLNPDDSADRELITGYMTWKGELGGRGEPVDGDVFK